MGRCFSIRFPRNVISLLIVAASLFSVEVLAKSLSGADPLLKVDQERRDISAPNLEDLRWEPVLQEPRILPIFGQSCTVFTNRSASPSQQRQILMYAGFMNNSKNTNDMRSYTFSTHHWEGIEQHTTTSIPWGRNAAATLLYESQLLVFGGSQMEAESLGDTWEFDITRQVWTEYTPGVDQGPSRRYASSIVFRPVTSSAILFGGAFWREQIYHNDLWSYSFVQHRWSRLITIGDSPSPRFGHCAAYYDEYMYIYGGGNGQYSSFQIVWAYSFKEQKWGQVLQLPPPKRAWAQSVVLHGWWFIVGGDRNGTDFIDVWRWPLDPASARGVWEHVDVAGPYPLGRLDHCAVLDGEDLYVIGGYSYERSGADDDMWKLNLSGLTSTVHPSRRLL